MDRDVKQFIEDNIEDINDGKWNEVYEKAFLQLIHPASFTKALWKAGINPLDTIDFLPDGYLMYDDHDDFPWVYEIPDHIKKIGVNALSHNKTLSVIYIPLSVKEISYEAFAYNPSLAQICYEGSSEDWDKIDIRHDWVDNTPPTGITYNKKLKSFGSNQR